MKQKCSKTWRAGTSECLAFGSSDKSILRIIVVSFSVNWQSISAQHIQMYTLIETEDTHKYTETFFFILCINITAV